jgi:hypothetical protein
LAQAAKEVTRTSLVAAFAAAAKPAAAAEDKSANAEVPAAAAKAKSADVSHTYFSGDF